MRTNQPRDVNFALSESAPSNLEVALLICERLLQILHPKYHFNSVWSSKIYAWYIQKVAFIHLMRNEAEGVESDEILKEYNDQQGECCLHKGSGSSKNSRIVELNAVETMHGHGSEIKFSRAYQVSLSRGLCELNGTTKRANTSARSIDRYEKTQKEKNFSTCWKHNNPTLLPTSSPSSQLERKSLANTNPHVMPSDSGFRLLLDLLFECSFCSDELCLDMYRTLIGLFPAPSLARIAPKGLQNSGLRNPSKELLGKVDALVLTVQFFNLKLDDETTVLALGNATHSFVLWMNIAWSCTSFEHQNRLANQVSKWLVCLSEAAKSAYKHEGDGPRCFAEWVRTAVRERPLSRYRGIQNMTNGKQMDMGAKSTDKSDIVKASRILRDIFEGHTANGLDMLPSLFTQPGSCLLPDHYLAKLLAMQGPAVESLLSRQELLNRGSRLTLFNITCGMLAYVTFYISLRSFNTAHECANLAIKVGQQLQSNYILALAHYCSFVVQMNSSCVQEAADSISIALQLTTVEEGSPALGSASQFGAWEYLKIRSICFASATELLLFYPGLVNGSLRSALSMGLYACKKNYMEGQDTLPDHLNEIDDTDANSEDERLDVPIPPPALSSTLLRGSPAHVSGADHAVVIQTIAQTARNALWMCEMESLLQPTCTNAWIDIVASLSRETIRMVGSIYGITSTSRSLDATSMEQLLLYLEEESVVHWIPTLVRPSHVLLAEMVRHVAHKMLMVQSGRAWHLTEQENGPLHLAYEFLRGVRVHYGNTILQMVEENFFFAACFRYVQGCWLARSGFATAAYDLLQSEAYLLYSIAGMPDQSERSKMINEITLTADDEHLLLDKNYEKILALYIQKCSNRRRKECFFWSPDLLLVLTDIQYKRSELALYMGYPQIIDDMAELLEVISASCSFVYGTLMSQLLQLMSLQQRSNFSGLLQSSVKLLKAVEGVGFTHLAESIRVRQATTLSSTGEWAKTLEVLQQIGNVSLHFEPWQLLTRLTAHSEALLTSTAFLPLTDARTASITDAVAHFLSEGIEELEARRYLGNLQTLMQRHFPSGKEERNESVGVSLYELLCIHTLVARSAKVLFSSKTSSSDGTGSRTKIPEISTTELAEVVCQRHRLRHVYEDLFGRRGLKICEMMLKGELGSEGLLREERSDNHLP